MVTVLYIAPGPIYFDTESLNLLTPSATPFLCFYEFGFCFDLLLLF